jgi:hypothetical protein
MDGWARSDRFRQVPNPTHTRWSSLRRRLHFRHLKTGLG